MIDVHVKIEGDKELDAKLRMIEAAAQGKHPEMQKAWKRVGVMGLRDQRQGFLDRAQSGWPRLGLTGVLLRRGAGPIGSFQDVQKASAKLRPLRDRGILLDSLSPGGKGVLETGDNYVRFGTRVPYAKHHHKGGTAPFSLDARKAQIVSDNLQWDFGSAPDTTPTGKPSHAKKDWNPWAFMIWNALKKKTSIKLPKRPIIMQPTRQQMAKYLELLRAAVRKVLGQ